MKKTFFSVFSMIFLVSLILFSATACQKNSYGKVLDAQAKLTEEMLADNLNFKYPQYMGSDSNESEYQYVAVKSADDTQYTGYKIYCFGSPFYTSVTAYDFQSDALLSDETARTTFHKSIASSKGDIDVYAGKGHKDALYLIGCINIDKQHYEIRVTANEEMKDDKYVNAIYEGNECYDKAFAVLVDIAENLE